MNIFFYFPFFRLAFTAFEKDYVNLIDESLTQEVQRRYQLQANGYEVKNCDL